MKSEILDHPDIVAGITMIEEMTHFVQFQIWGEKSAEGTNSNQTIEDHDADPFEAEARIIKNQLLKLIYPEYILREVQPDRKIELAYEIQEACDVALLPENEREKRYSNVFVEDIKDFPTLIHLALRQTIMANYGLSNEELDSDNYQEFYKEWYETNTKQHIDYAKQQIENLKKESKRASLFGMEFTKDETGRISSHPYVEISHRADDNIKQ